MLDYASFAAVAAVVQEAASNAPPDCWQYTRLQVPMLDRLTREVVTIARRALR